MTENTSNNSINSTGNDRKATQHRNSSLDTPKWVAVRELNASGASTTAKVVSIAANGAGRTCGLNVSINGLDAFLPGSELPKGVNQQELVGKDIAVKVIEVNRRKGRLIVSRKSLAVEEQTAFIAGLADLTEVTGVIARKSQFGYFINLGPVDGLLHISQIPLDGDTEKELTLGDTVTLRIREVDTTNAKVGLSMLAEGEEDNRGGRNNRGGNRGNNGGNRGNNGGNRGNGPVINMCGGIGNGSGRFAVRESKASTPAVVSVPTVIKPRSTKPGNPPAKKSAFTHEFKGANPFAALAAWSAERNGDSTVATPAPEAVVETSETPVAVVE